MVVLDKVKGAKALPARTVTIELQALDARPRLVVAGPGSVIEIKNGGKVRHELSTPDTPKIMPLETLAPGAPPRRQRFDAPGGYVIRDSEYPHIMISVIIVDSPYYAAVDEKGSFEIKNVPDGTATLKVWTRGKWVAEQEIDGGKQGRADHQGRVHARKRIQAGDRIARGDLRMFFSKIWFILIALVSAVAATLMIIAPHPFEQKLRAAEGQRLDRAQYAAEQMFKVDAHKWMDHVSKLGRDAIISESLDAASRGSGEYNVIHRTIQDRFRTLIPDLASGGIDTLVAVDNKGRVVARVGDNEKEYGDNIMGAEIDRRRDARLHLGRRLGRGRQAASASPPRRCSRRARTRLSAPCTSPPRPAPRWSKA